MSLPLSSLDYKSVRSISFWEYLDVSVGLSLIFWGADLRSYTFVRSSLEVSVILFRSIWQYWSSIKGSIDASSLLILVWNSFNCGFFFLSPLRLKYLFLFWILNPIRSYSWSLSWIDHYNLLEIAWNWPNVVLSYFVWF